MKAMVLTGHGDLDKLVWHEDWPKPEAGPGEVLVKVKACGLNNTDVNTRSGWYSKAVTEATTGDGYSEVHEEDPSWGGSAITFPRIQGADICGIIEAVGEGVDRSRIGERVITDNWLREPADPENLNKTGYLGSEVNGGFAEYAALPSRNLLAVNSDYTDAELATFSCSYSTAEGMLTRANVGETDTVFVPGASGGVGGAVVQLAKLRGARVLALTTPDKAEAVNALGADKIIDRTAGNLSAQMADEAVSVVADVVGGPDWPDFLDLLQRGGRYTCSGAIAGPIVSFDLRTFYLRDLTFTGSTVISPEVMPRLVSYIEAKAIKPVLAATYPLAELHAAQTAFINKAHVGNIVVCP
ncbi:Zn-dependent oxidoreductase, NADPH:quinone reductase [SAR116 cluster alpha proteobacterium HIMB100]|nr:Zn-dependent oxidoreductase, NADPH:quinone reductase [SAR116 cluster alpha proteobacterium HIMB100]